MQGLFNVDKWYRQHEEYAEEALSIRDAYLAGDIQLVEPDLAHYEFANVMRYMGELTTEQVQLAVEGLFAMRITWVTPTKEVMTRAMAIARSHDATVYDAVFAALAEVASALYVTADMHFVKCVPDLSYVRPLADLSLP